MKNISSLAVSASLTTLPSCYIACHVMYKSCVCSYSRNENKCKKTPKDKKDRWKYYFSRLSSYVFCHYYIILNEIFCYCPNILLHCLIILDVFAKILI